MREMQLGKEDIQEVVKVIHETYGYDFGDYSMASLSRRLVRCMEMARLKSVFDLKYNLTNDPAFFNWFLESVTVNVTEMFRDPDFYRELREKVLLKLAAYPTIKIWHAGCSTGEEVYSMAIMLKEEGLLDRAKIYATDINPANIEKARNGIVPLQYMKEYTKNYIHAGGHADFSSYYTARYGNAIINKELKKNILFTHHNLVTDQVFNEFQLICCRNVLIYFNKKLQNRVVKLFHESLSPLGYLAIGSKESLMFSDMRNNFETISSANKIFRRKK